MLDFFTTIDDFVWGPPLLVLLVGTGVYLTIRLGLLQVLRLPKAFKLIFAEDKGEGDISSFAALATALAATVGTGNIVGVATAIKTGGPGALFWMWIAAFFGMATKYSEGLLAIKFRTLDDQGNVSGGPMYYITHGFSGKWQTIAKPLAYFFAFAGVLVAWLGIGTFSQVNSITASLQNSFDWSPKIVSVILALITAAIIFGGIQSISKVSEKVVPFMAGLYILAALVVIFTNFNQLLPVLEMVFQSAFTGKAAVGGFAGATVMVAMRLGIARGVFSNESGLGSAPIAAAAAKTEEPVEQGLISMTGTFIDTIIICTLTGLAILVTGQWSGNLEGAPMTQAAFSSVFGTFGEIALTLSLVLFAFTTILGWSYYGERCFEFIFKSTKFLPLYRLIFVVMVALGGYLTLDVVWKIADIVNGLMALPNLIALLVLSPIIFKETKSYFERHK
ncbi:Sodium/glycine symporter GlyP [Streptococcus salivarius]|uniref:alanine/glycine:cation symporter family protein n=1 Tax=Streptococcus TaxID=1301 RepID=UPI00038B8815|nr:sodium:alanine symporter family protein [Streptococcus salivarius]ALR79965.1 Sodium/glycine symporter GlyP [Streptococcus salivarius]MDU5226406.1 sodium:alanine symporter family protein [Streptococcus sp.]